jgi:hypothetical protein
MKRKKNILKGLTLFYIVLMANKGVVVVNICTSFRVTNLYWIEIYIWTNKYDIFMIGNKLNRY